MGSCQHTDGFQSIGDSPASMAARCKRAPGAAGESRTVEEDAGAVDNAGVGACAVAEDATLAGLDVMLEAGRGQRCRERGDHPSFVHIAEISADRTAAEAEVLRRLGTDALAASTPQASPRRLQEIPVEAPDRLTVGDLLHP